HRRAGAAPRRRLALVLPRRTRLERQPDGLAGRQHAVRGRVHRVPVAAGDLRRGRHRLGRAADVGARRGVAETARGRPAPHAPAVGVHPRARVVHHPARRGARRPEAPGDRPAPRRHGRPHHVRLRLPALGLRLAHAGAEAVPGRAAPRDHGVERLPPVRAARAGGRGVTVLQEGATAIETAVIDTDVHCSPSALTDLSPHLDPYWRGYIAEGGLALSPTQGGAYPPAPPTTGAPAPTSVDQLREGFLDAGGPQLAVLNCTTSFHCNRNPYYEAALCRAINDWLVAEWLERDERLRAS